MILLENFLILFYKNSDLPPIIPSELEKVVIEKVITFYSLPESSNNAKDVDQIIENLNSLFGSILTSQPTITCLCRLFEVIIYLNFMIIILKEY